MNSRINRMQHWATAIGRGVDVLLGFLAERDHRWSELGAENGESGLALAAISAMCEHAEMDLERVVQLQQFLRMVGDKSDDEFAKLVIEPMSQKRRKVES